MNLSGKDMRHLMYMERWATYSMATGALSLEEVMLKDNGQTFSSIVRNEDMVVQSFNMKELPHANILLVLGTSPRVLAYVAEIAIRHFDKYGYYPEFVAAGDGRGMFRQRRDMATWLENMMIGLGFDKEWVKCHHVIQKNRNRDIVAEAKQKLDGIFCRKKTNSFGYKRKRMFAFNCSKASFGNAIY